MEHLFMMTYIEILIDKESKYSNINLYTYVSWMYYINSILSYLLNYFALVDLPVTKITSSWK